MAGHREYFLAARMDETLLAAKATRQSTESLLQLGAFLEQ